MLNLLENVNPMQINLSQQVVKQTKIVILVIFVPKLPVMPPREEVVLNVRGTGYVLHSTIQFVVVTIIPIVISVLPQDLV